MNTLTKTVIERPLPRTEQKILNAVMGANTSGMHGTEIARAAEVKASSVYPLLNRLVERGLLQKHQEYIAYGSEKLLRIYYLATEQARNQTGEVELHN